MPPKCNTCGEYYSSVNPCKCSRANTEELSREGDEQNIIGGWLVSYPVNDNVSDKKLFLTYSEAKVYQKEIEENGWMDCEIFPVFILQPKPVSVSLEKCQIALGTKWQYSNTYELIEAVLQSAKEQGAQIDVE